MEGGRPGSFYHVNAMGGKEGLGQNGEHNRALLWTVGRLRNCIDIPILLNEIFSS